jgi:LDH2 family malate/lactate/ureidoglycolate dehydrogenase
MSTPRYPVADLEAIVADALQQAGVPAAIARVEAEITVESDLCGVPSHGVFLLPRLLAALKDGRANPRPVPRVLRESGATSVVDCDRGPGRYTAAQAMDRAVEQARRFGIGVCLAANATHWGRAHAYACRAARQGFVGLCTTNAMLNMTTAGLTRAVSGNNPLGIAVPRAGTADPVVLDIAMTQAAFGKVATWRREGRRVPLDWGVDLEGKMTDDPAAILASGLLLPMGGHKGIGLALMMELLTAGLAGGLFGYEIVQKDASGVDAGTSKLFIAIDVGALADREVFEARVETLLEHLHGIDEVHPLLAPGERGWSARRENLRDGVPIHPDLVRHLATAGVVLPDTSG